MLLTEKDSQIALLEMAGAKTQSQIERLNRLHSDRCRINKRLKIEVFFNREFYFRQEPQNEHKFNFRVKNRCHCCYIASC